MFLKFPLLRIVLPFKNSQEPRLLLIIIFDVCQTIIGQCLNFFRYIFKIIQWSFQNSPPTPSPRTLPVIYNLLCESFILSLLLCHWDICILSLFCIAVCYLPDVLLFVSELYGKGSTGHIISHYAAKVHDCSAGSRESFLLLLCIVPLCECPWLACKALCFPRAINPYLPSDLSSGVASSGDVPS